MILAIIFITQLKIVYKFFFSLFQSPLPPFFCIFVSHMQKPIEKIVSYIVEKKFPLFGDINVSSEKNPFRDYTYGESGVIYDVTLIIDFKTFLMEYWERWNEIKELVTDTIKFLGIENIIRVKIMYSDNL